MVNKTKTNSWSGEQNTGAEMVTRTAKDPYALFGLLGEVLSFDHYNQPVTQTCACDDHHSIMRPNMRRVATSPFAFQNFRDLFMPCAPPLAARAKFLPKHMKNPFGLVKKQKTNRKQTLMLVNRKQRSAVGKNRKKTFRLRKNVRQL